VIWSAVLFALASATTTGLSTAVQHHVAGDVPLAGLFRRPAWVASLALAPVGFGLHAAALHFGPIALVQPIVVVGVAAALPFRAALSRTRPRGRELVAVGLTLAALAAFLLASSPAAGRTPPDLGTLLVAAVGCGLVAVLAAALPRVVRRPGIRAPALGVASGVLFGLMAVLIDAVQLWLPGHPPGALAAIWLPYGVVACGVGGLAVNQLAYAAGPLSASMPVLNVVNCLLTVGFGVTVLHDTVQTSVWSLLVAVAALLVIGRGLWSLAAAEPADAVADSVSARDRRPPRRTSSTSSPEGPSARERAASGC